VVAGEKMDSAGWLICAYRPQKFCFSIISSDSQKLWEKEKEEVD
jgi:hypothetical protein